MKEVPASIFVAFALAVSWTRAQTSTSSYVEPTVPTGVPLQGDYTGALRPQIHYSPPRGFMVGCWFTNFTV